MRLDWGRGLSYAFMDYIISQNVFNFVWSVRIDET